MEIFAAYDWKPFQSCFFTFRLDKNPSQQFHLQLTNVHCFLLTGTQYMVSVLFSGRRGPVQTYGRLQLMLVDKNGINETFALTQ
jgi:hypothetical protein